MDTPFPFSLPLPTAFYLVAYVLTLVIHVVFMNYVLAGTGALAIAYLRPSDRGLGASTKILKEWLPFMLSGAITAGIAPLLFVQILYKQEFYTANLLLFNRWMAILPVLIIGFYTLYLLKSRWLSRRAGWLASLVALVPILCVGFTGYSWTENHLLSVRAPTYWAEFYSTRSQTYSESQLLPRLLVWLVGSVPTLMLILSWQHWYLGTGKPKQIAQIALVGLVLVGAASAWYYLITEDSTRLAFVSPMAIPYFMASILGVGIQFSGWLWIAWSSQFNVRKLSLTTAGLLLTMIGMTVCREAVRINTLGSERFEAHFKIHADAFGKGGLIVFLAFFVLNLSLIVLVFWLVRNHSVKCLIEKDGTRKETLC